MAPGANTASACVGGSWLHDMAGMDCGMDVAFASETAKRVLANDWRNAGPKWVARWSRTKSAGISPVSTSKTVRMGRGRCWLRRAGLARAQKTRFWMRRTSEQICLRRKVRVRVVLRVAVVVRGAEVVVKAIVVVRDLGFVGGTHYVRFPLYTTRFGKQLVGGKGCRCLMRKVIRMCTTV